MDSGEIADSKSIVKCIVCGRDFRPTEVVRFRGAITCRTCASKAMALEKKGKMKWPFWMAILGGFMGSVVGFTVQLAFFFGQPSIQTGIYYSLVAVSVGLMSLGFAGLSKNFEAHYGVIPAFLGLVVTPLGVLITLQTISEASIPVPPFTPPLGIAATLSADFPISLFMIMGAIVVLLTRDRFKSENITIVGGSVLLIAGSAPYMIPFAVPLAYFLIAILFITVRSPIESSLETELDYS